MIRFKFSHKGKAKICENLKDVNESNDRVLQAAKKYS